MSDDLRPADDLANDIDRLIGDARSHLGHIEQALDAAQKYADKLYSKQVPERLLTEARGYISMAEGYMRGFDEANEAVLDLRRAGDVALNDHYG